MPYAYIALLIYCVWMFCLLVGMFVVRFKAVKQGLRSKDFSPNNENISPFAYRLSRAHANCFENLPIFASIVLVASYMDALDMIGVGALVFIAARILQSLTHIYSSRMRFIMVRGSFYAIQVFLQIYWIVMLFMHSG